MTMTLNYRGSTVQDIGIVIAKENMSKVFSRFFTAQNRTAAITETMAWRLP